MDRLYQLYAMLFARPIFYRFNRALFHFALRGIGVLNSQTAALQGETALLERLLRKAPPGAAALDVGANEGNYSEVILRLAPQLELHAFEPHPETFARLERRLRTRGVKCHNMALGAEEADGQLFDYLEGGGTTHATLQSGVIERIHHSVSQKRTIRIGRLDHFLRKAGINKVFLLKIDVEGSEADVLRGLGKSLGDGVTIEYIQIEFNEMNVISRVFLEDLAALLPGYRAYRVLPRGALLDITDEAPVMREVFAFHNILFSR